MPFTANCLVRSAVGQIVVELKRMYRDGSHDLLEKAKAMQAKSLLGANIELRIQDDISSIENFLALNELLSDNRRI
ncbi:hypothetical protein BGZ97_008038, partial [Linnemannia gamsii]